MAARAKRGLTFVYRISRGTLQWISVRLFQRCIANIHICAPLKFVVAFARISYHVGVYNFILRGIAIKRERGVGRGVLSRSSHNWSSAVFTWLHGLLYFLLVTKLR